MDPISLVVFALAAGGAAAVAAAYLVKLASRRDPAIALEPNLKRVWLRAAKRLMLTSIETSGTAATPPWLTGRSGQLNIRVEEILMENEVGTRIEVRGLGHGPEGLKVDRQRLDTSTSEPVHMHEIEEQAPDFYREFQVEGRELLAAAVLDRETRWKLADLLRGFVYVEGQRPIEVSASLAADVLAVHVGGRFQAKEYEHFERILPVFQAVLQLAHRLTPPGDLAGRVAGNLREEPEAAARLRGLRLLSSSFPQYPATRNALLTAREDPSVEVRIEAGKALGDEGRDTLLALIADPATAEDFAVAALLELAEAVPFARAESAFRTALDGKRSELAEACREALGHHGKVEVEGLLVDALRHHETRVILAAIKALGRGGSVAAVPELLAAAARWPGRLPRAAHQAITEIHARLQGAEVGQLSLAGGESGALSLVEEKEPGRLSLAEEAGGDSEHVVAAGRLAERS